MTPPPKRSVEATEAEAPARGVTSRRRPGLRLVGKPVLASAASGLIASLCCGGSLVFASIGLGAFYGALGLWDYVPQVLAVGALAIVAINYLFFRRLAARYEASGITTKRLREAMFLSTALGLVAMAGSFLLLEWLNHALVNPHRFLSRPEYGEALIPGIPNIRLLYAVGSFWALALLWALPFPGTRRAAARSRSLPAIVLAVTAAIGVALIIGAAPTGHERSTGAEQTPGSIPFSPSKAPHSPGYSTDKPETPHFR